MVKVTFVEKDSKNEIGKPGPAGVPVGSTLHDAKNILHRAFSAQNPSMQGRLVAGIEWEGAPLEQDEQLDLVQHRDPVLVLIQ